MKKEEIAQYDELRSDVKAKTLILTQEKQKTEASVAKVMTFKGDTEAKNEGRNSRVFLTRKFKENNKDLLSRYEALVQKYKDSKELFNRLYDLAWEINPDISENEWRIFLDKNRDVGLSKEKLGKMPELEDSMFKMDSSGWERKKIDIPRRGKLNIKVSPNGDVVEFINGGEWLKGEIEGTQLFATYDVFLKAACKYKGVGRKTFESKYLPTIEKLRLMAGDPGAHSNIYDKFYEKYIRHHCTGTRDYKKGAEHRESFDAINQVGYIWISGGGYARFSDTWNGGSPSGSYGFAGRLLKD